VVTRHPPPLTTSKTVYNSFSRLFITLQRRFPPFANDWGDDTENEISLR